MRLVNRALAFTFALATSAAAQTSAVPIQTKPLDPANLDRIAKAMKQYDALKEVPDTRTLIYQTALG